VLALDLASMNDAEAARLCPLVTAIRMLALFAYTAMCDTKVPSDHGQLVAALWMLAVMRDRRNRLSLCCSLDLILGR